MALPNIDFLIPCQPCDDGRIRKMEKKLNRHLPEDYAEFIRTTGGGMVSLKNCAINNLRTPSGDVFKDKVDQIFGTNCPTGDLYNDLAEEVHFLVEDREIPNEVLPIGTILSEPDHFLVMNYDLKQFPRHAVLYLDTELEGGLTLVADSFTDFLKKLRRAPGYKEFIPSPLDGEQGIHAARRGHLGKRLQELISISPIPNMEQILRKAAENIAAGDLIQMYVTEGSFKFQDLIFHLAQTVEDHLSLDSWMRPGQDGSKSPSYEILSASFLTTHEESAVQYFDAAITGWYESRTELGVLKQTPNGLKLDEDYVRKVASQFE